MDLLFKRYASPFPLLDHMIDCGALSDFIEYAWKEKQEEAEWDFYLHKHYSDQSFDEFKEGLKQTAKDRAVSKKSLETTVQNSMNMLNNFVPKE